MLRLDMTPADLQAMLHGGVEAGSVAALAGFDTGFHVGGGLMHDGLAIRITSKQMPLPSIAIAQPA
jgi:hypothetical protein